VRVGSGPKPTPPFERRYFPRHSQALAFALFALSLLASTGLGGTRTGADGRYVIHDTVDAGGGRAKSKNAAGPVFTNDASLGGIGGLSIAPAPAPARTVKHGYAGQLYDVAGVVLKASPASVAEGETRQLTALNVLDDGTFLGIPAERSAGVFSAGRSPPSRSPASRPLASSRGTRNATVRGSHRGFSSSLLLSVLNVGTDDFGRYAGDQIDDAWQVTYFGEDSADAAPQLDPDGDGEDNLAEFRSNTNPADASSVSRSAPRLEHRHTPARLERKRTSSSAASLSPAASRRTSSSEASGLRSAARVSRMLLQTRCSNCSTPPAKALAPTTTGETHSRLTSTRPVFRQPTIARLRSCACLLPAVTPPC
jgi:hypothetical protein